ncbi:hypothetical protein DBP12_36905 [Streptomyces sp. CS014]|nr:hypothetical protein DBP12_36905 [Streptomyces sp. CS014]
MAPHPLRQIASETPVLSCADAFTTDPRHTLSPREPAVRLLSLAASVHEDTGLRAPLPTPFVAYRQGQHVTCREGVRVDPGEAEGVSAVVFPP